MKVLLVNGSPHKKGCTYTALEEVAKTLEESGIETEIFQVGNKPIGGCIGCGVCRKTGECFMKDIVNEFVEKAKTADTRDEVEAILTFEITEALMADPYKRTASIPNIEFNWFAPDSVEVTVTILGTDDALIDVIKSMNI